MDVAGTPIYMTAEAIHVVAAPSGKYNCNVQAQLSGSLGGGAEMKGNIHRYVFSTSSSLSDIGELR